MAINLLSWALLFGSFIALICSVIYALTENMKNRKAIADQHKRIQELETTKF